MRERVLFEETGTTPVAKASGKAWITNERFAELLKLTPDAVDRERKEKEAILRAEGADSPRLFPLSWEITESDAIEWFRVANTGPHNTRNGEPTAAALTRLVSQVNAWRRDHEFRKPTPLPGSHKKRKHVEQALRAFKRAHEDASWLHGELKGHDSPDARAIESIWRALSAAAPILGYGATTRSPTQPRKPGHWHAMAVSLQEPIKAAWQSAGRKQLSLKEDGPLVKVVAAALKAIDGNGHTRSAISSALRRHPKSRANRARKF